MVRIMKFMLIACVGICLQGCTTTVDYLFSEAAIPSGTGEWQEATLEVGGDNIIFKSSELDMSVAAFNQFVTKKHTGLSLPLISLIPVARGGKYDLPEEFSKRFLIEIRLDPKGSDISFDPMQVTFKKDDGTVLKPKGYYGPCHETGIFSLNNIYRLYGGLGKHYPCFPGEEIYFFSEEDDSYKTEGGPIAINQWTCFWLIYDTSTDPRRSFVLSVGGIEKNGKPALDISIPFAEGDGLTFISLPV